MCGMVRCGVTRCAVGLLTVLLVSGIGRAVAQENFDAGKKPAELFANDCKGCHQSPVGLSKASGLFGLESFLREHYTASRQSAAAIAGYLRAVDAAQPPPRAPAKRRKSEPRSKSADKPRESRPQESKPQESAPAEAKSVEPTADKSETKTDAKAAADKPSEPKPAEAKPADAKPADTPAGKSD